MSQWHTRYRGRGVMIYWHIDKNSACIYSQLKTCSSSEVGSMINGFLKHDSKMDMNKTYTDTQGQSVIGFAISYLLHFELLPRIKGINKQKLYYASKGDKKLYPNLEPALKESINWGLIEQHYHEAIRYMAALKTGTVETDVMIKHLSSDNYHHPVYKALTEIGNAVKTIFLCKYIASQELRIEINESLNIVERVNSIMGFIFYGKLGEISSNNKEEQELAIVCLHLLQVCMVYINTLLIQEVLSDQNLYNKLTKEDKRAITPLIHSHINPYGLFPLDLNHRLIISNDNIKTKSLDQKKVA
jgi:TnpA family transposase